MRSVVLAGALVLAAAPPQYPTLYDAILHRDAEDVARHLAEGADPLEPTPDGVPAAFAGADVLRVLRRAGLALDTEAPGGTTFFAHYVARWPDRPAQDPLAAGWPRTELERAVAEIPVPLRIEGARSRVVPRRVLVDGPDPRIAADGFTLVLADLEPEELFYAFAPADPLEGVMPAAATPIRIEGPEAEYRVEQRTVTSIQIDMEGPHFELDWRAGVGPWAPLPEASVRVFRGVERTRVAPGPYTLDELKQELRRMGPDYAPAAERVGLPPASDAHASVHVGEVVTRLELRLSVKRGGRYVPIKTLSFALATGC
jgi:hypothetical protein